MLYITQLYTLRTDWHGTMAKCKQEAVQRHQSFVNALLSWKCCPSLIRSLYLFRIGGAITLAKLVTFATSFLPPGQTHALWFSGRG